MIKYHLLNVQYHCAALRIECKNSSLWRPCSEIKLLHICWKKPLAFLGTKTFSWSFLKNEKKAFDCYLSFGIRQQTDLLQKLFALSKMAVVQTRVVCSPFKSLHELIGALSRNHLHVGYTIARQNIFPP